MVDDPSATPSVESRAPTAGLGLTRAEFAELARELQALRHRHQSELAERLRDARAHGSPGDNEDVQAVHEEASVLEARIARLEDLLRAAPIADREFDGCVSPGCTVRVAGAEGRVAEYVLVGRRSDSSSPREVSSGSPVGQALLGASPGQVVRVDLPNGRSRELRVLTVTPPGRVVAAAAASLGADAA